MLKYVHTGMGGSRNFRRGAKPKTCPHPKEKKVALTLKRPSHGEKGPPAPCEEKRSKKAPTLRKSSKMAPYIANFFPGGWGGGRVPTLAPPPAYKE